MIYHIRGCFFVSLLYHWGWSLIATYIRKLKDRSGNYVLPAVRAKGVYLDSNKTLSEVLYPVGAIFQSTSSTSPASMYGGSWEKIEGRFLLGTSSSYSVSSTGGEAKHTLNMAEMPRHSHYVQAYRWNDGSSTNNGYLPTTSQAAGSVMVTQDPIPLNYQGESKAHNNMPPYYSVYIWRRVA